uniref:Alpha-1,4-N-acetylglucosaminyltransferase-like n=1 Tax=Geotrypetes seraphini TaxID=260995 RepID=A0A6P8NT63_GEOSA|nr:alpha-1,4-N-acetylglucosaminyltransferase-like [Geotrypetes seraphini]XP_033772034.1 alpha-1,4-N-acetylglucosaminyltransferase-like [Geotrypetes seraphini]XP_033772043.1 alpha-1,4-N-acetylglucosaminyltransferase-like [Geotrypetes seraphini]
MKSRILCSLLFVFICSTIYWMNMEPLWTLYKSMTKQLTAEGTIKPDHGIFFVETTEKLEPSSLVVCAVESASQMYPKRTIYFFMKGLAKGETINKNSFYKAIQLLSSIKNIQILPLDFEEVFNNTPLYSWYQKVNPATETFWPHVSADGFRLAMIWKYGGMYMDTDIISLKPVPEVDFLAFENVDIINNAVFGFQRHDQFLWDCMEDFVKNYRGYMWGHQGPRLLTRVIKRQCEISGFKDVGDITCRNISILNTRRFYPLPHPAWERYFQVWNPHDTFNNSYGLHLWNFKNKNNKQVIPGSNSVAENLFMKHCPLTYEFIVKHASRK